MYTSKQTSEVWIIEGIESSTASSESIDNYFYPSRASALEACYDEFGHVPASVVFRKLKMTSKGPELLFGQTTVKRSEEYPRI